MGRYPVQHAACWCERNYGHTPTWTAVAWKLLYKERPWLLRGTAVGEANLLGRMPPLRLQRPAIRTLVFPVMLTGMHVDMSIL